MELTNIYHLLAELFICVLCINLNYNLIQI